MWKGLSSTSTARSTAPIPRSGVIPLTTANPFPASAPNSTKMEVAFPVIQFGTTAVSATHPFALLAIVPTSSMEPNASFARISGRAASAVKLQGALLATLPLH